jgi:hypothetical protein
MWAVLREIAEWWTEIEIEKLMWGLLLWKCLGLNKALRMWSVHESAAALRRDSPLKELEHCSLPWSFACPKTNAANGSFILKRNYSRNPKSAKQSNNLRRTHFCFWFLHRLLQCPSIVAHSPALEIVVLLLLLLLLSTIINAAATFTKATHTVNTALSARPP